MPEKEFENLNDFRAEAYRLYQLDWMRNHGYGPRDIAVSVLGSIDEENPSGDVSHPEICYANWQHDCGFDGELWACYDEFLDAEYKDSGYMIGLLPAWMHPRWYRDVFGDEKHIIDSVKPKN